MSGNKIDPTDNERVPETIEDEFDPVMSEYEFGPEEETVIARMASRMKVLAILLMFAGLVALSPILISGYSNGLLIGGLLWLLMGVFFFLPVDNFKRITTSRNHDISELIQGFRELNKGWTVILVLLLLHRGYLIFVHLS